MKCMPLSQCCFGSPNHSQLLVSSTVESRNAANCITRTRPVGFVRVWRGERGRRWQLHHRGGRSPPPLIPLALRKGTQWLPLQLHLAVLIFQLSPSRAEADSHDRKLAEGGKQSSRLPNGSKAVKECGFWRKSWRNHGSTNFFSSPWLLMTMDIQVRHFGQIQIQIQSLVLFAWGE